MAFFNKLKWILGIVMVFVLIMATDLLDRNNFLRVRDSIVTIYEDRLVAKDIIFDMSKVIGQKRVALAAADTAFFSGKNNGLNTEMNNLTERFEDTKLTYAEQKAFDKLKEDLTTLQSEERLRQLSDPSERMVLMEKLTELDETLEELSEIQMVEGRRQMKIGKSAASAVELFTQIEIYFLVILAIIIQVVILYNPPKEEQD